MPEKDDVRLLVCGADEAARAGVVARLRGAAAEAHANLPAIPARVRGSAVAILGGDEAVEPLLRAGAHVLVVAVPVLSRDTTERLFAAARDSGVEFVAANPDRHLPSRQLVRRQIPDAVGEPGLIRIHCWEPAGAAGSLLHDLDVALWLFGRRPDRVYAVGQADGYVQVHLGFPNGGMALLVRDGRLPPGDGYQSLSVIAAGGATYADDHQNVQLAFRGGPAQALRTDERAGQLAAVAQEFIDAIRSGRDLTAENERAWRDVFAVADAVRESLATGRAVGVEER